MGGTYDPISLDLGPLPHHFEFPRGDLGGDLDPIILNYQGDLDPIILNYSHGVYRHATLRPPIFSDLYEKIQNDGVLVTKIQCFIQNLFKNYH